MVDPKETEYVFRCSFCEQETTVIHYDEGEGGEVGEDELDEMWPGPYCEQCGHFKSYRLTSDDTLKLFWVETEDHSEDWFIVARDRFEAEAAHEGEEGYGDGDASARFIRSLPPGTEDKMYPSFETLEACGGTIVRRAGPRVVEFDGVHYTEGPLEHTLRKATDDAAEVQGLGRPNRTQRDDRIH